MLSLFDIEKNNIKNDLTRMKYEIREIDTIIEKQYSDKEMFLVELKNIFKNSTNQNQYNQIVSKALSNLIIDAFQDLNSSKSSTFHHCEGSLLNIEYILDSIDYNISDISKSLRDITIFIKKSFSIFFLYLDNIDETLSQISSDVSEMKEILSNPNFTIFKEIKKNDLRAYKNEWIDQ